MKINKLALAVSAAMLAFGAQSAMAACSDVKYADLHDAASHLGDKTNAHFVQGGYGLPMWVTMVDESGKVCHVTTSGTSGANASNNEWLGSRVISAQKANTANAFSIDGYAISTANLYSAVQPGGSLYGLQLSNPVDTSIAYQGGASSFGTNSDPLRNKRIGGINVFGGGVALYKGAKKIGAIGVSGDTSCRDHAFAFHLREHLGFAPTSSSTKGITTSNFLPKTSGDTAEEPAYLTGATTGDEMIYINNNATVAGDYWNAWAQPACPNSLDKNGSPIGEGILLIPTAP